MTVQRGGDRRRCVAMLAAMVLSWAPLAGTCAQAAGVATFDYEQASKRALVIGNQRYAAWPLLRNARNDALLMADTFRALGFQVTLVEDADARAFRRAIDAFSDQLAAGGVAAVYYAGHGVQAGGRNYLVPADTGVGPGGAALTGVPVDELLKTLRNSGAQASLVLLDACRNDPQDEKAPTRWRGASSDGFMEPARVLPGMLVAYATQPGERAQDGPGQHGPFAAALARWLPEPGMRLGDAMEQVKRQVRSATQDEQRPLVESSLVTDFPLTRRAVAGLPSAGASTVSGVAAVPPPLAWFQWSDNNRLMLLTAQINRRVAAMNADDLPLLEHQARHGSAMAQAVLGGAWRQGFGVGLHQQRSARQARKWLAMAAAQHMPYALTELGEMVFLGQGGPAQVALAQTLFSEAAQLGYPPAKLDLLQARLESSLGSPEGLPGLLRDFAKQP